MDAKASCLAVMLVRWLHHAVIQSDYFYTTFTTIYIDRAFDVGTTIVFKPQICGNSHLFKTPFKGILKSFYFNRLRKSETLALLKWPVN